MLGFSNKKTVRLTTLDNETCKKATHKLGTHIFPPKKACLKMMSFLGTQGRDPDGKSVPGFPRVSRNETFSLYGYIENPPFFPKLELMGFGNGWEWMALLMGYWDVHGT